MQDFLANIKNAIRKEIEGPFTDAMLEIVHGGLDPRSLSARSLLLVAHEYLRMIKRHQKM